MGVDIDELNTLLSEARAEADLRLADLEERLRHVEAVLLQASQALRPQVADPESFAKEFSRTLKVDGSIQARSLQARPRTSEPEPPTQDQP